jgi:integrase
MTPELLLSYIRQLIVSHSHRTAGYNAFLIEGALEVFAPDQDWTWIRTITRRLKIRARCEVPSVRPVLHAAVLYDLGLQVMQENCSAEGDVNPSRYRSGLIVALLAAAPMRIANFAVLEIGRHLRDESGRWTIRLEANETKTRRSDVWPIPDRLRASLDYYLEEVRPSLLARAHKPTMTARLWIGDSGRPIGDQVLRRLIARLTRERLGTQINPHTFRHCAATTLALERPRDSLQSSALLGHASPQTTEQHYIVQQRQLVQQDYLQILRKRSRCSQPSEQ